MENEKHDAIEPILFIARSWVTWLTLPILFIIGIWFLALWPQKVLQAIPALHSGYGYANISSVIAPHPKTMYEAWRLGELQGLMVNAKDKAEVDAILVNASQIAGRPVSQLELQAVGQITLDMENNRGVVSRVLGLFTFVNVLWAMAILGIAVFIIPAMAFILQPVLAALQQFFFEVLLPILLALKPVYEVLGYMFAYVLAVEAYRYPQDVYSMTNIYLAMSSSAAFLVLFLYTSAEHAPKTNASKDGFVSFTSFLCMLTLIPTAVSFQSTFLGLLAVMALCISLGFIVMCYGFCWIIGFQDESSLLHAATACFLLNLLYMGLRVAGTPSTILKPFATGVGAFGGTVYFLALLIFSSKWCSDDRYWARQMLMCASLLLFIGVGTVFHMPSMANTAITFAVLYFVEKYTEISCELDFGAFALAWLLASVGLYSAALYLNRHPAIIAAMVDAALGKDLA